MLTLIPNPDKPDLTIMTVPRMFPDRKDENPNVYSR
jgi:hypothetical protein